MKNPKFSHKTPHLKGKQHQLDPNLDLKQLVHHAAVQYVDRDADGDVDVYDNPKKRTPDENPVDINVGTGSRKLLAKQKGELKHTRTGMAYEDLRKWFGTGGEGGVDGGGWDRYNSEGERIGKCAREPGEAKPKCLSKEKAAEMSKDEIAAAVRRKREKDPVADRPGKGGKPKMVSNKIEEQSSEERYCPMCRKREKRMDCSYGPAMWDAVTIGGIKESKKPEPDHEHSMARSELATIEKAVKRLKSKMKGEGNIEAWVQSKITKAADYIDAAADYIDSGEHNVQGSMDEAKDPCWKGYKQEGLKKKGTRMVPNCVPVESVSFEIGSDHRSAQKQAKIRNLAKSTTNSGEKEAAKSKLKGPSLPLSDEYIMEKNVPTNPKLWAKWKAKAKAKFDVYPSAYANGWAAKGYKSEGGGWKSVSEETIEDLNGNSFVEVIDLIKPDPIVSEENGKVCEVCGKSPCECSPRRPMGGSSAKPGPDKNYVKPMGESVRIPAKTGNIILVTLTWRGKYYMMKLFFPQTTKPSRQEVQDQISKVYPGSKVQSFYISDIKPGEQFLQVEDWQKVNRQDKTDGLSQKAVNAYRRENPGSKLQTAVTEKNPEGKRAARRKSFCSRMSGMKKRLTSSETARDPDSRINKALRRWNCN
jgi:hypothetical protein